MTSAAPTYDLVMLLDPQADDAARAKIVTDARSAVQTQGELLRHDEWGERALAYPIDRHASAEYHLLQFHAPATDLLSGLDRSLRITDGVLRFRIVKLKPGVPDAPDMRSPSAAAPHTEAPQPSGAQPPATEAPAAEEAAAPESPAAEPAAQSPAAESSAAETPAAENAPPADADAAPGESA